MTAALESPEAFAKRTCDEWQFGLDRKSLEALIREGVRARDAAVRAEAMRVRALYSDALSVIAHHPGGDEVADWMKSKAREALAKTQAAERGEIYGALASGDSDAR